VQYLPMAGGGRLPFSAAARVGSMLYLSGQIGTDSTLHLVPGGIGPETRQTMENIRAILAQSRATLDDVIRCTVMMADMKEWGDMNQVYAGFQAPARAERLRGHRPGPRRPGRDRMHRGGTTRLIHPGAPSRRAVS
jgi:enamine deaminase RidA (YjgF/YER057c/UK114 family)